MVEGLLSELTERQRQVLRLRYGLDEADGRECSLAEIAARLDTTETGVSETLKKALAVCRRLAARHDQPQPPPAAQRTHGAQAARTVRQVTGGRADLA